MKRKKILIIDDEEHIIQMLRMNMKTHGYDCLSAATGEEGIVKVLSYLPDLILLDVMLPGIDGVEVCRQLKENPATSRIPVLMLSARSQGADKIIGLKGGADDYITKPFSLQELFLRIGAAIRQVDLLSSGSKELLILGTLSLDAEKYIVSSDGQKIDLTLTEFRILYVLMKNSGFVVSRESLISEIFDKNPSGGGRSMDVHIRNLRKKFIDNSVNNCEIITLRGIGFKIV